MATQHQIRTNRQNAQKHTLSATHRKPIINNQSSISQIRRGGVNPRSPCLASPCPELVEGGPVPEVIKVKNKPPAPKPFSRCRNLSPGDDDAPAPNSHSRHRAKYPNTPLQLSSALDKPPLFMQNKPNPQNLKANITPYATKDYEENHSSPPQKNKPNQTQFTAPCCAGKESRISERNAYPDLSGEHQRSIIQYRESWNEVEIPTCRGSILPILPRIHALITQNKPNFQNEEIAATSCISRNYPNFTLRPAKKNKPNQTQSCRGAAPSEVGDAPMLQVRRAASPPRRGGAGWARPLSPTKSQNLILAQISNHPRAVRNPAPPERHTIYQIRDTNPNPLWGCGSLRLGLYCLVVM